MVKRFFLLLVFSASAMAATEKIPPGEASATIRFPDRWKLVVEGDITGAISPDMRLHFLIIKIEHSKGAEAMGEVMNYIRNVMHISVAADSMQSSKGELSGREAHFMSWQGTDHDEKVAIHYALFSIGINNGWLAAYWGKPETLKEHQRAIDAMIKSVKPIAPEKE